jgi:hypothetical protein
MRQAEDHHHLAAVGSSSGMALDKDLPAIGRAPSYVPTSFSSQPAPESRIQLMAGMITFSTVLIVVRQVSVPSTSVCKPPSLTFNRSIYRSIELLRGWTGPVAVNEPLFLGMDATMMVSPDCEPHLRRHCNQQADTFRLSCPYRTRSSTRAYCLVADFSNAPGWELSSSNDHRQHSFPT